MDILKFSKIPNAQWDKYIGEINGTTFKYTSCSINFEVEYAQTILANESFIAVVNHKPIAAMTLYINEDKDGVRTISWNGRYCMVPLLDNNLTYQLQEKYLKKIFKYITEIEAKYQCSKSLLSFDSLKNPQQQEKLYNYNFLMKYGYMEQNTLTQLIDLRQDEQILFSEIKNGHRGHMKKGEEYDFLFFGADNIREDLIQKCRQIYEYDAGMVTRNSELIAHYLKFIQQDCGVLGFAKYREEYLATIIATYYKNTAYYSLYAEMTDKMNGKPAGHKLQWELMKYLKAKGIEFYELGEQVFGNTHYATYDKKLINISTYKREFGGYTVPIYRGVKEILI